MANREANPIWYEPVDKREAEIRADLKHEAVVSNAGMEDCGCGTCRNWHLNAMFDRREEHKRQTIEPLVDEEELIISYLDYHSRKQGA